MASSQAQQSEQMLPTFEQLERLKLLREMGGSGISVTRTEMQMVELVATKEALLYAVLLFEQPDYEHLVEAHGLTGEDVDAMKMIIGPKLLTCVPKIWGVFSEMLRLRRSRGEARQCFGSLRTDSLFQYVFDVCLLLLFWLCINFSESQAICLYIAFQMRCAYPVLIINEIRINQLFLSVLCRNECFHYQVLLTFFCTSHLKCDILKG